MISLKVLLVTFASQVSAFFSKRFVKNPYYLSAQRNGAVSNLEIGE